MEENNPRGRVRSTGGRSGVSDGTRNSRVNAYAPEYSPQKRRIDSFSSPASATMIFFPS